MSEIQLHNCDCLELLKTLLDNSVDLFLQDPPYNTTNCKWEYDLIPLLPELWKEWIRVGKDNATFVFTGSQPFTTDLICSNRKMFKYELIWDKVNHSNPFLAPHKPLPVHENIIIFSKGVTTYNPQKKFNGRAGSKAKNSKNMGKLYSSKEGKMKQYDGYSSPMSILQFIKDSQKGNIKSTGHPTQKPIKLFEYLIKTYSNENDTVFDGYLGSGTTAFAAHNTNRNFIGAELDKSYFDSMQQRFNLHASQSKLF